LELLDAVRSVAPAMTRLRLDTHLCAPGPTRRPEQTGRPHLVGARLPTPTTHATDQAANWTSYTVTRWYGERERLIQLLSATAVWYHTGLPPVSIRWVLIRDPWGKFATQAVLGADVTADPLQIVSWFVLRWQLEVTYREVRAHLGMETQRQWSDRAIARTTPALLGLFSLVTLLAHAQIPRLAPIRRSAWRLKPLPTFADALALIRQQLWTALIFQTSPTESNHMHIPRVLIDQLMDRLCFAA
jgi:hypothetical protein